MLKAGAVSQSCSPSGMTWLFWLVGALIILRLSAQLVLEAMNRAEAQRHVQQCPPALAAVMDAATYAKSVEYTLAKSRFSAVETVYDSLMLGLILGSGALPWFWEKFNALAPGAAWSGALFLIGTMLLLGLPGLPFEWWSQFRLEAKFGFNQSTLRLWVTDQLKSWLLGFAIGFPLLWALLALVGWV